MAGLKACINVSHKRVFLQPSSTTCLFESSSQNDRIPEWQNDLSEIKHGMLSHISSNSSIAIQMSPCVLWGLRHQEETAGKNAISTGIPP